MVPLYWLSYELGDWFFTDAPVTVFHLEWVNDILTYSRRFLFGNLILATVIAFMSYLMVARIVRRYRHVRVRKKERKRSIIQSARRQVVPALEVVEQRSTSEL